MGDYVCLNLYRRRGGGEVQSGSLGSEGKTVKGPEKEGAGCRVQ